MKIIKLTPVVVGHIVPILSPQWITGMEQYVIDGKHIHTVVYAARQGLYHKVKETPEQIESLLNDEEINVINGFAKWLSNNNAHLTTETYPQLVSKYLWQKSQEKPSG